MQQNSEITVLGIVPAWEEVIRDLQSFKQKNVEKLYTMIKSHYVPSYESHLKEIQSLNAIHSIS